MKTPDHANADGLRACVKQAFETGITFKDKIVSFNADGASVNTDVHGGLIATFQKVYTLF